MAQQKTRTFLLGRFEAGDRPTDQDFANLFESILFLNNDLSGHNNGLSTDNTTIEGNFAIGGTLDLTGNFKLGAKLSVGNTAEALQSSVSAYNTDNFAIYYASGSVSDVMFEGVSQDVTSSIKLTEALEGHTGAIPSTNTLIFGTSAGRVFLQNDGQEILHMTSSGHNGSSPQVFISGSVGIGSKWENNYNNAHLLHIRDHNDVNILVQSTKTNGRAQIRFKNDAQEFVAGTTTSDSFVVYDATSNNTPFKIETAAGDNTLVIDSNDRVGILTASPDETLDVRGDIILGANSIDPRIYFRTNAGGHPTIKYDNDVGFLLNAQSDEDISFSQGGNTAYVTFDGSTERVGIKTTTPEATIHVLGLGDGSVPMMLIEGGESVPEQDILILRDLGTADLNKNNIKFEATSGEHTISQIQAITRGSNASSGGDLNIFTYSDDTETANTNQLYLRANGNIGIGTASPSNTLHVNGTVRLEVSNANNNFITFTSQTSTQANQHYYVGNNATWNTYSTAENYHIRRAGSNPGTPNSKTFATFHAGNDTGGDTEGVEFSVPVTASFFKGDGSGLTGLQTAATVSVLNDGDNRIVTANGNNTLSAETNLNFDGNQLGIGLTSPNAGVDVHINHNATNDVVLLLESHDFSNDSTVALRQQGTWPNNASGVDLVYDGADDKFYIKGYSANDGGFQGNSVSIKSVTPSNTLVLDSIGQIGMGIGSPTSKLHVDDTASRIAHFHSTDATSHIRVERSSNTTIDLMAGATSYGGGLVSSHELRFMVNGDAITSPTMTIDTTNRVGIGVEAPTVKLDVDGKIHAKTLIQIEGLDDNTAPLSEYSKMSGYGIMGNRSAYYITNTNASGVIRFGVGGTHATNNKMGILANGNVGIGLDTPSNRLSVLTSDQIVALFESSFAGTNGISVKRTGGDNVNLVAGYSGFGGGLYSSDALRFSTNASDVSTPALYIETDGKVGIGTDAPENNLHIQSNEDAAIYLEADTDNDGAQGEDHNAFIKFTHDNKSHVSYLGTLGGANLNPEADASTDTLNNSLFLGTKTAHGLQLVTNNVARLTVLSDGKIGIGTNAPTDLLHVLGADAADANGAHIKIETAGSSMQLGGTSSYSIIQSFNSQPLILNELGNNVGIGLTNPVETLDVEGKIQCKTGLIVKNFDANEGGQINLKPGSSYDSEYIIDVYQAKMRFLENDNGTVNTRMQINDNGTILTGPGLHTQLGHATHTGHAAISHPDLDDTVNGNYALLQSNVGDLFLNSSTGAKIYFRENNADKMRLVGGNFGIGVDPAYKLDVAGVINGTGGSSVATGLHLDGRIEWPLVNNTSPASTAYNETNTIRQCLFMNMDGDDALLEYGHIDAGKTFVQFRLRDNNTGDRFRIYVEDYTGITGDRIPFEVEGKTIRMGKDGDCKVLIGDITNAYGGGLLNLNQTQADSWGKGIIFNDITNDKIQGIIITDTNGFKFRLSGNTNTLNTYAYNSNQAYFWRDESNNSMAILQDATYFGAERYGVSGGSDPVSEGNLGSILAVGFGKDSVIGGGPILNGSDILPLQLEFAGSDIGSSSKQNQLGDAIIVSHQKKDGMSEGDSAKRLSLLAAYGNGGNPGGGGKAGHGALYIGESHKVGGGMAFCGLQSIDDNNIDEAPAELANLFQNNISLYRYNRSSLATYSANDLNSSGTNMKWVMRYAYNSNTVNFISTIVNGSSDSRLKENVVVIGDAIDKIKQVRGITFNWNSKIIDKMMSEEDYDEHNREAGVLAQEIEKVLPEAVTEAPFDSEGIYGWKDGEDGAYKTVMYEKIVPLLIEGIKEQQTTIETLEARLKTLEDKLL